MEVVENFAFACLFFIAFFLLTRSADSADLTGGQISSAFNSIPISLFVQIVFFQPEANIIFGISS